MKPIIDHIQITVKNMKIAEPFYDKLMPIFELLTNLLPKRFAYKKIYV